MEIKNKIPFALIAILFVLPEYGCKKFLDAKPNQSLVTPTTLSDARALMDSYLINQSGYPNLAHGSNDDYYVTDDYLAGTTQVNRGIYMFTIKQETALNTAWESNYAAINRANLVIHLLTGLKPDVNNEKDISDCLGHAYFLRAYRHLNLATFFAMPYVPQTAAQTPGIPVRVTPDITEPTIRGTIEDTYRQIESDLQKAIDLLPALPSAAYRPGRAAAFSAMAHVMLHKRHFGPALDYARQSLALQNTLIDFNTINPNANISFTIYNPEVLFQAQVTGPTFLSFNNWRVDSLLYREYAADDLRKLVFFRSNGTGTYGFKGDMGGISSGDHFAGITIGETWLIAAEAAARLGNTQLAMEYLNGLLEKRFRTGRYIKIIANSPAEAFEMIRKERRKELVGRGLRWLDLRRWNFEGVTTVRIERLVNGTYYRLDPTSKNFVFEIPSRVIDISGIAQNERE